jgi:hypothetical protein
MYQTYNKTEIKIMGVLSNCNIPVTKERIINETQISETAFETTIHKMMSSGIVTKNDSGEYQYSKELDGDVIILDGSLLLPVVTITKNDKLYVTRGVWYEFPIDFDIRRIVWNEVVDINVNGDNMSLVEMLMSQSIKEKKTSIRQLPEYEYLKNKIIPYSDTIGLHIIRVGEESTEVRILFKTPLTDGSISAEHKGFGAKSVISTHEMLHQLDLDVDQRTYENIQLNRVIEIRDIIYSGNEIPLRYEGNDKKALFYVKLTSCKNGLSYEIRRKDIMGNNVKIDTQYCDSLSEGIEELWEDTSNMINKLLKRNDFNIELE